MFPFLLRLINWDGRILSSSTPTSVSDQRLSSEPKIEQQLLEELKVKWKAGDSEQSKPMQTLVSLWNEQKACNLPAPNPTVVSERIDTQISARNAIARSSSASHHAAPHDIIVLSYSVKGSVKIGQESLLLPDSVIRISAPRSLAKLYFEYDEETNMIVSLKQLSLGTDSVHHWIFNCTYNRRARSMLDYTAVMQSDKLYRRVVVCRDTEFQQQIDEWGKSCVILQLPPTCRYPLYDAQGMPKELLTVSAVDCGIGYARLCIQLLSREWGLSAVWMLDDNILRFYECSEIEREEGTRVPRMRIDTDMDIDDDRSITQSAFTASSTSIAAAAASSSSSSSSSSASASAVLPSLNVHAVPFCHVMRQMQGLFISSASSSYALIGTSRDIRSFYIPNQIKSIYEQPHKRTHCYSACLVNINACFEDKQQKM